MVASLRRSSGEDHGAGGAAFTAEGSSIGVMPSDETLHFERYVLPVRTRSAESPSPDGRESPPDAGPYEQGGTSGELPAVMIVGRVETP